MTLTYEAEIKDSANLDELRFDKKNQKFTGILAKLRTRNVKFYNWALGYLDPIEITITATDIADKKVSDKLVITVSPSWQYMLTQVAYYLTWFFAGVGFFKYRDEMCEILCR